MHALIWRSVFIYHGDERVYEGEGQSGVTTKSESASRKNPEHIATSFIDGKAERRRCYSWYDVNNTARKNKNIKSIN